MKIDELREIVKCNNNCNFIAMAITPIHAVGIDATIRYLKACGIVLDGYILMTAHPNTGRVVSRESFTTREDNIRFLEFEYTVSKKQSLRDLLSLRMRTLDWCRHGGGRPPIYVVWTEVYNNLYQTIWDKRKDRDIVFVQIDDGAASYISDFKLRLSYLEPVANGINGLVKAYMRAAYYAVISGILRKGLYKNENYLCGTIFKKYFTAKGMKIDINTGFAPFYTEVFSLLGGNKMETVSYEDAIVINTQCLVEGNITDGVVDLKLYQELASVIMKYGQKVTLKPHPREREIEKYENLGWEVINTLFSQEAIIAKCVRKPLCVISIYSSTLLNVVGIFGIPAISIAKIMLKENIGNVLEKELKRYINMYEGQILFPRDWDELDAMLRNIIQNHR